MRELTTLEMQQISGWKDKKGGKGRGRVETVLAVAQAVVSIATAGDPNDDGKGHYDKDHNVPFAA